MDPSNRTLKKDSGRKLQVFLAGHIHGYENKQHCRTKIRRILNKCNVASYDAGKKKSLGMNLRLVIGRMRDIMRTLILRQKRLAQIDNSDLIIAFVPKERALGR